MKSNHEGIIHRAAVPAARGAERKTLSGTTRRRFILSVAKTVAAGSLAALDASRFAHAAGSGAIRLGLVGCGGRGTDAARKALATGKDVKLVAMADILDEKLAPNLELLRKAGVKDQLQVPSERRFVGFDAFQRLLASGVDAVILATPPGFRALHFDAAVKAGIHSFLEKPVAVDAPGVRQVRAAAQTAREKGLSVIVGFHEHFDRSYEEFMAEISKGTIGRITKMEAIHRMRGFPRSLHRADLDKQLGRPATEMEFQIRNWSSFAWLSGDFFVEMLVHHLNTCLWAIGAQPSSAQGVAERKEHTSSDYGDVSDYLSVKFRFENGAELLAEISALSGTSFKWQATIEGEKGVASRPGKIVDRQGRVIWNYSGPKPDPYQEEMTQWCASIRNGKALNMVARAADSTMVAILGRTAAYTRREVTWAEIERSTESFFTRNPKSFQDAPPELPDKFGDYQSPPRGILNGMA